MGMQQRADPASQIRRLADNMKYRRQQGEKPYILVLGAGASLSSGASSGADVIAEVVKKYSHNASSTMTEGQKVDEFYKILKGQSPDERYAILMHHIKGKAPSPGYEALAQLAQKQYLAVILSTNYDTFLEDALNNEGLRRKDFAVFINGVHNEDEMVRQLSREVPPIKIIKLHGDLYYSSLLAFSPEHIWQFSPKAETEMRKLLNSDLIVVGHSMRDNDINRCIDQKGGSFWYINLSEPAATDPIGQILRVRPSQLIAGELGKFDNFFATLRNALP